MGRGRRRRLWGCSTRQTAPSAVAEHQAAQGELGMAQQARQPFPAPRGSSNSPGEHVHLGAGTSQPPPSVLTCTLDFLFAFSTDFTVSPAADRAAIRDSISDIFRRRRKDTQMVVGGSISGFVCHHWPGKASLRARPSPRSQPAAPEQLLRPLCPPAPTAPSP